MAIIRQSFYQLNSYKTCGPRDKNLHITVL
jgi:hypothetical protein